MHKLNGFNGVNFIAVQRQFCQRWKRDKLDGFENGGFAVVDQTEGFEQAFGGELV